MDRHFLFLSTSLSLRRSASSVSTDSKRATTDCLLNPVTRRTGGRPLPPPSPPPSASVASFAAHTQYKSWIHAHCTRRPFELASPSALRPSILRPLGPSSLPHPLRLFRRARSAISSARILLTPNARGHTHAHARTGVSSSNDSHVLQG